MQNKNIKVLNAYNNLEIRQQHIYPRKWIFTNNRINKRVLRFCGQNKMLHGVENLVAAVEIDRNAPKDVSRGIFSRKTRRRRNQRLHIKMPGGKTSRVTKAVRITFATVKKGIFVVTFAKLTHSFESRIGFVK